MKYLIVLFKGVLRGIYFILKLFPTNKKKVVFISRQQNRPSMDFLLLKDEINKIDDGYKIVFLCKKMGSNTKMLFKYFFHILRQMYHLATSSACVVDSYSIAVSVLNHKKSLKVIQIWHAIATVKKFGHQTIGKKYGRSEKIANVLNMHNNYDWVISGSEVMVPIFAETFNIEKDRVKAIGTPRIDYLIKDNVTIRNNILTIYPELNSKKVILYAPTFRRNEVVDFEKIISTVDLDEYNLIIKTHPVKKQKISNDKVYSCKEFTTMELLTVADYVVTDYSAISIEASLLGKAVFFYVYDYESYVKNNGLNIDIFNEMKGCCYKSFKPLYKKIQNGVYDYAQLEKFRDKYVSNQVGDSGYILANFIVNNTWLENRKRKVDLNE